jgi:phospholipid/cholesterol/gamma-HCH transport system ATP-binding protein
MNDGPSKFIAKLEDVSLSFGDKIVLRNCNLDIAEGAITCIVGLSGAGKSTILRLLDGLIRPNSGHIFLRGQDICHMTEEQLIPARRKISLAFQFAALLDSLTVGDNVALPLQERGDIPAADIRQVVMDALDSVGLEHTYDNLPSELSGGMLKRAGFARAIVTKPDLVLYDEPTTGLDPVVTSLITNTIVKLRRKLNGTAVVISHDLESIYTMADYVAMLFEGAVIACDTVQNFRNSSNPIVQQFIQGSLVGPIPI